MWDPGCILIVLFFCHVYYCYSNKSVNKWNAFVTLRWFSWRCKCTFWRCDMLAPSPRQLLRPSASSKQGRTFHRWARWRHTGSGQRGALSFGGGVGQVLGKTRPLSSSKRISGFRGRNVHLWWVTRVMVCACMCWYGQSVTSGCRSLPFLSVFLLRGCDWPQGRMDHNMVSFLKSASGSCASVPLITRFYPWRRRAVSAHRGWQEISRLTLPRELLPASSPLCVTAPMPNTGPLCAKYLVKCRYAHKRWLLESILTMSVLLKFIANLLFLH